MKVYMVQSITTFYILQNSTKDITYFKKNSTHVLVYIQLNKTLFKNINIKKTTKLCV